MKIGDTVPATSGVKLRLPPAEGNKLEQAFGLRLFSMRQRGEIRDYAYEAVKLRLAKSCFYTPDFVVWENDQSVTMYETKGFWRDDARVKIKVAARLFPMLHFIAVENRKGLGWVFENIGPKPSVIKVGDPT